MILLVYQSSHRHLHRCVATSELTGCWDDWFICLTLVHGPSFRSLSTLPASEDRFFRNRYFQNINKNYINEFSITNNSFLPLSYHEISTNKRRTTTPRKFNKNNHDSNNNSIESIRYKFWIRPNTKTVTSPLLGTSQVCHLHFRKLHWMRILLIFNLPLLDWVIAEIEGSY